jgi:Putative DNA-binding domain
MNETQFAQAIRSVNAPVPHRRFSIYRNNVAAALVTALQVRFPVTAELVGEEFFRAMAASYAESHKPQSPILIHYGELFPGFVERFEPAKSVAYLADVARLEALWWRAYHASDVDFIGAEKLSGFAPEALGALRFTCHPSASLISSRFAILRIWHAHNGGEALGAFPVDMAEHVLVSRAINDVELRSIPQVTAQFIGSLLQGRTLMDAVTSATETDPDFNLATHLAQLFQHKIITEITA